MWRSRGASPTIGPASLLSVPPEPPAPPPGPLPRTAAAEPGLAPFASRRPDWAIPLADAPLPWTERWGRKALGWSAGALAVIAVAGAATWMVRESQVQTTLAVLADSTQDKTVAAVSGAIPGPISAPPEPTAAREPEWTPPPLRMLPPPVVAIPAAEDARLAAAAQPKPAPEPVAATPKPKPEPKTNPNPKPKPKPERAPERARERVAERSRAAASAGKKPEQKPERRALAAAPKKTRPAPDLSWAAKERERMLAQARPSAAAAAPAQRPAQNGQQQNGQQQNGQQQAAAAEAPLAETLRLCRAAGYHAAACMKRRCEATRYGLVCRG